MVQRRAHKPQQLPQLADSSSIFYTVVDDGYAKLNTSTPLTGGPNHLLLLLLYLIASSFPPRETSGQL
ncbi:MAG TPA: hypothetical protein V6D03_09125 [Candidatus Caenarcaniphilales bacterium]